MCSVFVWTQEEVCDMINKRYNEFLPSMQGAEALVGQVEEVSREISTLQNCIETEVRPLARRGSKGQAISSVELI